MTTARAREEVVRRLASEVGITIDGRLPWDLRVHAAGSTGGRSLTPRRASARATWRARWDCDDRSELGRLIARGDAESRIWPSWRVLWHTGKARLVDLQSRRRAAIVARSHYDVTVDHYSAMTDPWRTMGCGYWNDVTTLAGGTGGQALTSLPKLGLSCPGSSPRHRLWPRLARPLRGHEVRMLRGGHQHRGRAGPHVERPLRAFPSLSTTATTATSRSSPRMAPSTRSCRLRCSSMLG